MEAVIESVVTVLEGEYLGKDIGPTLYQTQLKMADPRLRQLKIKTGVVKRLAKEQEYNHKEIAQQEKRIETFKAENRDEYDIKKQYEVLEECKMMVPDTQQRLKIAFDDLKAILDGAAELKDTDDYKTAQQVLAETSLN
eukprot:gene4054-6473_t